MLRRQTTTFLLLAIFLLLETGSVLAQSKTPTVPQETVLDSVWEADAPMAAALTTCFPSSAPELQRQFDPVTGESTGPPELKQRVLAVTAGDSGQLQAIRVTWDAMPNWPGGHEALDGQQKWMTAPFQVCENGGNGFGVSIPNCGQAPGLPQKWFWAARMTCDRELAWYGDLFGMTNYCSISGEPCTIDGECSAGPCGVDGVVHILDPGIVPSRNVSQKSSL